MGFLQTKTLERRTRTRHLGVMPHAALGHAALGALGLVASAALLMRCGPEKVSQHNGALVASQRSSLLTLPSDIRIEPWRGGAEAALSLSFDDGSWTQFRDGLPLWRQFGFRVTIAITCHIPRNSPQRWPDIQAAFDAGHELANHTVDHLDMTRLPLDQMRHQIDDCNADLLNNVRGLTRIDSYVHPMTLTNATLEAELAKRFILARGGAPEYSKPYFNDPSPANWYDLLSFAPLHDWSLASWDAAVDEAVKQGKWLIEQSHGIGVAGEEGVGWEPRTIAEFTAHYSHVASYGDRLWVAPMTDVARYLKSRSAAKVNLLHDSEDMIRLTLSDGLPRQIYTIPLTVSVNAQGWSRMTARQGGTPITVRRRPDGRFQFEAVADSAPIELYREGSCTPNCAGKQCGADGCGGSCGSCTAGFVCDSTQQCKASQTQTRNQLDVYLDRGPRSGFSESPLCRWSPPVYDATSTVHSGSTSIARSVGDWQCLGFEASKRIDKQRFCTLEFQVHGGNVGGQHFWIYQTDQAGAINRAVWLNDYLPEVPANSWSRVSIPLSDFNGGEMWGFVIEDDRSPVSTAYFDRFRLRCCSPGCVSKGML